MPKNKKWLHLYNVSVNLIRIFKLHFPGLPKPECTLPFNLIWNPLRPTRHASLELLQTLTPTVLFFGRFVEYHFLCKTIILSSKTRFPITPYVLYFSLNVLSPIAILTDSFYSFFVKAYFCISGPYTKEVFCQYCIPMQARWKNKNCQHGPVFSIKFVYYSSCTCYPADCPSTASYASFLSSKTTHNREKQIYYS